MINTLYMWLLASGIFLASSLSAQAAQAAQDDPREKLRATIDAALDVIYSDLGADMSLEDKQVEVRERLEAKFDLDVIIRRAIGRNWRLMSESEQTRVLELVKQLVLKAYVKGLDGKQRPEVTLGELIRISDKRVEVESRVLLDGQTYFVLYRLGRLESGWQIYDIVAENISVVSNYRQQIDDHFRKGNGSELVARLEELLAQDITNEDIKI